MSDDCKKTLTFYEYAKVRAITRSGTIEKQPRLAPAPAKTGAQILRDLNTRLDADIAARNAIPTPQCGSNCDYLETRLISDTTNQRIVHIIWTERFELRDADGNVIKGTARYRAYGRAKVQTKVFNKYCNSTLGEPEEAWENASIGAAEVNIDLVGGYALSDLWETLQPAERESLEFIAAKT